MNNKELEVIIKKLAATYEWDVEFISGGCFIILLRFSFLAVN